MKSKLILVAAALAVPSMSIAQDAAAPPPPPPSADRSYYADDRAPPPPPGQDREYHGEDRSYHEDCKRSSGTTGMLAGAGGGGLIAGVLGASPLGIAAGVIGGGVLGRHLDKKHDQSQNEKNGC
jgi:hypothetical protein